jgi:hypothetical protein
LFTLTGSSGAAGEKGAAPKCRLHRIPGRRSLPLYPHRWFATRSFATTLPQGLYAALLTGLNNGAGLDLVEVYDLGQ